MKKRIAAGMVVAVLMAAMIVLTGCFNELLYGTWRYSYIADGRGENPQEYFMPITFELRKNGDIIMYAGNQSSKFGTFTRDGHLYTLTYANPTEGKPSTSTGSWEIITGEQATELHIFPDEENISYILQRTIVDDSGN